MNITPVAWWPAEQSAWRPPEDLTVSQWAARYRVLPKQSAIPGLWSNALVPYTRGVMDAFNDPLVERITIMASVQSAKTESAYNMLAFAIAQDPAPALVVMPTDKTLKRVNKRLQDMILESPELSQYLTGNPDDLQKRMIVLKRMEIHFATAGSKADLANVEARYILLDEPDRYPVEDEDEGSAIERAEARATTYWNRKIIIPCTPTVPEGYVNQEYGRSDQRQYWVPCPECGGYQPLVFRQLKHRGEPLGAWPRGEQRRPEYIKLSRAAVYECRYCQAEIEDTAKPEMLGRGKWVPRGHAIARDGAMEPPPRAAHVGFHWWAAYSPFRNWSEIAAQWFASQGDREKLKTFTNLWLAEPWAEVVTERPASAILAMRTGRPAQELPPDILGITAGIDNQKRGFWISVWAHQLVPGGDAVNHHLIRYGYVKYFEELEEWLFRDLYRNKDNTIQLPISYSAIDTGGGEGEPGEATQTDQIYSWLRRSGRGRVFGVKGASKRGPAALKAWRSTSAKTPVIPGGLWLLDTHALKEAFWSRVTEGKVHLHASTGEDFAAQLAAEIKVRVKDKELWQNIGNRANHLLDATLYAFALAEPEWLNMGRWPVVAPIQEEAMATEAGINPVTGQRWGSFLR